VEDTKQNVRWSQDNQEPARDDAYHFEYEEGYVDSIELTSGRAELGREINSGEIERCSPYLEGRVLCWDINIF
jgi:hypothetical protein